MGVSKLNVNTYMSYHEWNTQRFILLNDSHFYKWGGDNYSYKEIIHAAQQKENTTIYIYTYK